MNHSVCSQADESREIEFRIKEKFQKIQFSSVQSLSRVRLFVTP